MNMEVCVLDAHNLPTTNFPTTLTHDGRISAAGHWRAAVVVFSKKTRLVLNSWERRRAEERSEMEMKREDSIKNMSLIVIWRHFLYIWSKRDTNVNTGVCKMSKWTPRLEKIKDVMQDFWQLKTALMYNEGEKSRHGLSFILSRNKSDYVN